MSTPTALVSKLWNYCRTATAGRDNGMSYGDYVEQLPFLPAPEDKSAPAQLGPTEMNMGLAEAGDSEP